MDFNMFMLTEVIERIPYNGQSNCYWLNTYFNFSGRNGFFYSFFYWDSICRIKKYSAVRLGTEWGLFI